MPLIGCIFLPKVATYKWHIYCFLDTCNFFSHFFDKTERNNPPYKLLSILSIASLVFSLVPNAVMRT